jgi:hypothetical protein
MGFLSARKFRNSSQFLPQRSSVGPALDHNALRWGRSAVCTVEPGSANHFLNSVTVRSFLQQTSAAGRRGSLGHISGYSAVHDNATWPPCPGPTKSVRCLDHRHDSARTASGTTVQRSISLAISQLRAPSRTPRHLGSFQKRQREQGLQFQPNAFEDWEECHDPLHHHPQRQSRTYRVDVPGVR